MADETSTETTGNPAQQLMAQLARSGRMKIAAALVVTALVGGGLGVIMLRGEAGGLKLLMSGLELNEAAEMSKRLDVAGIKNEINGSAVMVEAAKVDEARLMLAEQDLPSSGSFGWELFDKTSALGETSFVLNIKKLRAQEGELQRTISKMEGVKSARVQLAIPEKQLLQKESEPGKAAVFLTIVGSPLSSSKVRAIRNLVATTPGISIENVTVADTKGTVYAAGAEGDDNGMGGSTADERKSSTEDSYRRKVLEAIEKVTGKGAATVMVSAKMDFNRISSTSETIDPESKVTRSSQTSSQTDQQMQDKTGDETSVAKNVPTGAAPAADATPEVKSSSQHTDETVNFDYSKTTSTQVSDAPRLERLTVAVLVDDVRVAPKDEKSPPTWTPRTPEQLAQIEALVKTAVGFDEGRKDVVTISNISFARPDMPVEASAPGAFDFDKFDLLHIGELVALLVTALGLVFFVLRPLVKGLMSKDEPAGDPIAALSGPQMQARAVMIAPPGMTPEQAAAAGLSYGAPGATTQWPQGAVPAAPGVRQIAMPEGVSVAIDMPTPERLDAGIDLARVHGQVKASSIKKISEVVSAHPDESISIIRSWMAEESPT